MSDWRNRKPAPDSREMVASRFETIKQNGGYVDFCTNILSDRGFVFHCRITPDGRAIVESSQRWWCREYKDADERIGECLGEVKVAWVLGSSFTLKVADLSEGRG